MSLIFVADDDQAILELIEQSLSMFFPDDQIVTQTSTENIVQAIAQLSPDVILLDIYMPGTSGLQITKQLKADKHLARIPLILMTGDTTDRSLKIESLESGADAFLSKPFDISEISAQVRAMLRLKHAEDEIRHERDQLAENVKELDEKLEDTRLRWDLVLRSGNDGIWDWNLHTGHLFVSDSWKNILGYYNGRFTAIAQMINLVHKDDRRKLKQSMINYLKKRTSRFQLEIRMLSSTGEFRWMLYRGHAVWDKQGRPYRMIGIQADVTEHKKLEARLKEMAHHDSLTNLPNRVLLFDRAEQVLASAQRKRELVVVFFVDLDGFKAVNDTYGHSMGDLLLQEVSYRLTFAMRKVDTVARIGGDEFVLMLPGIKTREDIILIASRTLSELARTFELNEASVNISGSLGICIYPEDGLDINTLIHNADEAMYQAKQQGKNRFAFYREI